MFDLVFEHVNRITHVVERRHTIPGPFARITYVPDQGALLGFDQWHEPTTVNVPVTNTASKLAVLRESNHGYLWHMCDRVTGEYAGYPIDLPFNRWYIVAREPGSEAKEQSEKSAKRRTVILEEP